MKQLSLPAAPLASATIEPGVLSVFRTVVALQLGLSVMGMLIFAAGNDGIPHRLPWFNLAWTAMLLIYLYWGKLLRRLGRFYLPLALAFATVCTFIEYGWELQTVLQQLGEMRFLFVSTASGWRLLIGLLAPLLIVASQYSLRVVAGYVGLVALIELGLFAWIMPERVALVAVVAMHVVVFGLISYIVNRTVTAQRQQREALAEANRQLAQHAATLEQLTISRERNRLARELHDTLAHTLSAVSVQLEAVDSAWDLQPERARELLAKALAQTRSGLTETRRALQALRASPLEDLGLALAVRNLAESTAKRGALALDLTIDEDLEPLPPELEQQIYRVAQEALTNVLKHAGAQRLRVQFTRGEGLLTLLIGDDGRGFERANGAANGHYGLHGMQERADLIGARLTVQSASRDGTTVRLTLPEGER
jgi:signal transduction histidine kinase